MPNSQTHCKHGHEFNETNTYIKPNGTRFCRACRNTAVSRAVKKHGPYPRDREKANAAMRRFQRRVRELLFEEKLARGCAKCGYREHGDALQFDHIVPIKTQKRTSPKTISAARELLTDPNVQVLCANCHAIKSNNERRG